MDIQPLDIVIHIINIVVLYLLLRVILYNPVSKFLHARADGIQQQLDDAKAAGEQADALRASYEGRMQAVEADAQQLLLDETQKANITAADILKNAKTQADQIVREGRERAETERGEALQSLKGQITDLSLALASEVLAREVTAEDNQKTIDAFFEKAR